MKINNICKFPVSTFDTSSMSISCFVRESNTDIMKKALTLTTNRIVFCIDGNGSACVNNSIFPLQKGSVLFCFTNETVFFKSVDALTYTYIDFAGTRAEYLLQKFNITPLSRTYEGFDGLIPLWSESLFRASDKTIELVAESILLYTFSRLFDEKGSENSLVGQIVHITEKNFKIALLQ